MAWEPVIGLEIHVQLKTKSKIFSSAATAFGAAPNTQACLIDLGMPGVLPVLNDEVVNMAIRFGLAIDATIEHRSVFARKNYFYPDLPKGYQISQFELPILQHGELTILLGDTTKRIGITRAHLEEDAGKSIHDSLDGKTGIDLNRAGTPLLEIVSEPDMRSAKEAVLYLKSIHNLVKYLDICDGNMQEGSFRVDANVSIRPQGQTEFGTRTETKNLNSFRFIEKAINHEIERQIELLEQGRSVMQETRLYDATKDQTRSMRSKEEANDYRYFPDPDLLPLCIDNCRIDLIASTMPELPTAKCNRYISQHGLNLYDATLLSQDKHLAQYFESILQTTPSISPKLAANWMLGELLAALNKAELSIESCPLPANQLAKLLSRITDQTVSGPIAKQVFELMWDTSQDPDTIIEERGLKQVTDTGLISSIIDDIIAANPKQVQSYQAGKDKLFGFFVGQVMKATQGKANPKQINQILSEKLKK